MPSRQMHVTVGTVAGFGVAAYKAHSQKEAEILLEAIGGGIGGYIGSRIPDVIEPASWPGHRRFAHSATAAISIMALGSKLLTQLEQWCCSEIARCQHEREQSEFLVAGNFYFTLMESFLRFVTGILRGVQVGYLSHLVLDAGTPAGLPIWG